MANADQAAKHLGVDPRLFMQWLNDEIITRQPRGSYDLGVITREALGHFRKRDRNEFEFQRARAQKTQADKNEVALAEKLGELAPRSLIEDYLTALLSEFNTLGQAVPKTYAKDFKDPDAEAKLRKIVGKLFEQISNFDIQGFEERNA